MNSEGRKRVCFCLQVKPDRIAEYKARHAAIWPEMLKALSQTGWHNYSLFLLFCLGVVTATFFYQLPFGRGRRWNPENGVLNQIVSGWQFSGIYSLQTGAPLSTTANDAGQFIP